MSRRYAKSDEPNLMKYNFPSSSAINRFVQASRDCIRNGNFSGIEKRLVDAARNDFTEFRDGLDTTTPHFADELADLTLGAATKRRVVVVQGQFEGDHPFESTIGYDLGTQQHMMYRKKDMPKGQTIDEYLTREAVKAYLREQAAALRGRGIDGYRVRYSVFFCFRDADLRHPIRNPDGSINMEELLPLVADTILSTDLRTGYIGTGKVTLVQYEQYAAQVPPFVSHRIKSTLARKFARQFSLHKIKEEDVVTDAVAHRVIVATIDEVRDLERRIRDGLVGKSTIEIIPEKTKDYYRKPKKNGYRALKLVAYATTRGHKFVRELQLVDASQYYRNEINPNDSAHHRQQVKKEELSEKQLREMPEPILEALQNIFGKSTILISLDDV